MCSWLHTQQLHSVYRGSFVGKHAVLCRSAWITGRFYRTAAMSGEKVHFRSTALSGRWTTLGLGPCLTLLGQNVQVKKIISYLLLLSISAFVLWECGTERWEPMAFIQFLLLPQNLCLVTQDSGAGRRKPHQDAVGVTASFFLPSLWDLRSS